jgi:hypothetical protein
LTQRTYGIWWYEWGCGKPKRKTLMINTNAIHVQVKEGANSVMPKASQPL